MIIKAGTYRFNTTLTIPYFLDTGNGCEIAFPYICNINDSLSLYCNKIYLFRSPDAVSVSANFVAGNGTLWGIYDNGIWTLTFESIIVETDQTVDTNFGEWFTENTTMLIKAGTYRWNDELQIGYSGGQDDTFSIPFYVTGTLDSIEGDFYCNSITIGRDGAGDFINYYCLYVITDSGQVSLETLLPGAYYESTGGWGSFSPYTKGFGQVATVTADTYVPTAFGLWASDNAKVYKKEVKYNADILLPFESQSLGNGYAAVSFGRITARKGVTYFVIPTWAMVWGVGELTDAVIVGSVLGIPVTGIISEAFFGNSTMQSIYIPATIQEIGSYAFSGCSNLTSVTFGGTVAEWNERFNWSLACGHEPFYLPPVTEIVCSDGVVAVGTVELSGSWRFNETVEKTSTPYPFLNITQNVNFTTTIEGTVYQCTGMWVCASNFYDPTHLEYQGDGVPSVYRGGMDTWLYDSARIVDFGTEPQFVSSAFKEWVVANAKPYVEITDLTGTTWYVPSGKSVPKGLGIFNVAGSFVWSSYTAVNKFNQISLGYSLDAKETQEDAFGWRENNGDAWSWTGQFHIDNFTFTFTGGSDATNPDLIAWLQENGELQ